MIDKSTLPEKDRLIFIQRSLKNGLSREETALMLGYKNWRGLDIYMRRQGMRWNSKNSSYYYPASSDRSSHELSDSTNPTAARIISRFNEKGADAKTIAQDTGFKDHREMAAYMSARGYIWSNEIKNYTRRLNEGSSDESKISNSDNWSFNNNEAIEIRPEHDKCMERYIPLFDIILKHKERLLNLLVQPSPQGVIPRYTIPGITRTKSFYMSDALSKLIYEFSRCYNISQKEIIEAAVIEFLRSHSFSKEVDAMLNGGR